MAPAPTTKVVALMRGGLGNQLFIYAAARRLALVNGAELVIDHVSGFVDDPLYRRRYQLARFAIAGRAATAAERLEPFARARRFLARRLNQRLPFERRRYLLQQGEAFDPRLLRVVPRATVHLDGYWQSEDYFADIAPTIRADLRFAPPDDRANVGMAARIRAEEAVAVHVRFYDSPGADAGNNVPGSYYARALAAIAAQIPHARFFVFSDRPEAARAKLPRLGDRLVTVEINDADVDASADLWLMTQCRHFVIANSTFSWWGAWLAGDRARTVIVPAFDQDRVVTTVPWGFAGQIPVRWTALPVAAPVGSGPL